MSNLRKLREKLTDGELRYANEYLKTGNKLKSYAKAYPNEPNPKKVVYMYHKRLSIQNYIKAVQDMESEKAIVTKEWVLTQLQENAQLAKDGVKTETVTYEDGEEVRRTETTKPELANANKATELLGKHLNMFNNEVTISGLDEIVKGLQDKGDALAESLDTTPG